MRLNANVELDAGTKTFASGLLPDLIAALRRSHKGDLVAVTSRDPGIGPELETWCRFTRNSLIDVSVLLLRTLVAQGSTTGPWRRAGAADRHRGRGTRRA
jgi:hypothetical protein